GQPSRLPRPASDRGWRKKFGRRLAPPGSSCTDEFWDCGAFFVELRLHSARHPLCLELRLVFGPNQRILHPIGNRSPSFGDVNAGVVGVFLPWRGGLAPRVLGGEPGPHPPRGGG